MVAPMMPMSRPISATFVEDTCSGGRSALRRLFWLKSTSDARAGAWNTEIPPTLNDSWVKSGPAPN